jgi:hypothetical protein
LRICNTPLVAQWYKFLYAIFVRPRRDTP